MPAFCPRRARQAQGLNELAGLDHRRGQGVDTCAVYFNPLQESLMLQLKVNGQPRQVDVAPDTPLLWVLRDTLQLTGTKYGCGQALCGACVVHVDGVPARACLTPVSAVAGRRSRPSKPHTSRASAGRCRRPGASSMSCSAATASPGRS
jgi:hypothetical protein